MLTPGIKFEVILKVYEEGSSTPGPARLKSFAYSFPRFDFHFISYGLDTRRPDAFMEATRKSLRRGDPMKEKLDNLFKLVLEDHWERLFQESNIPLSQSSNSGSPSINPSKLPRTSNRGPATDQPRGKDASQYQKAFAVYLEEFYGVSARELRASIGLFDDIDKWMTSREMMGQSHWVPDSEDLEKGPPIPWQVSTRELNLTDGHIRKKIRKYTIAFVLLYVDCVDESVRDAENLRRLRKFAAFVSMQIILWREALRKCEALRRPSWLRYMRKSYREIEGFEKWEREVRDCKTIILYLLDSYETFYTMVTLELVDTRPVISYQASAEHARDRKTRR